jgi:uncharacterized Ntn-hydrolase superfamily protein
MAIEHSIKGMRVLLAIFLLLLSHQHLFATWSIIIIDSQTREIGIAGASCTYNCYGIGKIIPGRGAIIVQAMSNNEARAKGLQMILANATPAEIIKTLRDPSFDPERQQYAIVILKHIESPATYTGDSTKQFNGSMTANGISVQGNTLTNDQVLKHIFDAAMIGRGKSLRIDEILMLALEAGSTVGGDSRCGDQRATSAFLMVAKPDDRKPYLNLTIFGQKRGGPNAVKMLRHKYDKWIAKHL